MVSFVMKASALKLGFLVSPVLTAALSIRAAAATTGYSNVTAHCSDLLSFTGNQEAPTVITNATYNPANATYGHPAFCEITAQVATFTKIVYRFPAEGSQWSGIFTGQGCGGPCGYIRMDDQGAGTDTNGTSWSKDYLAKGFAVSFTNLGHDNNDYTFGSYGLDSFQFAYNNRSAEIHFGYLSTHYQSIVGKLLVKQYYGVKPRLSIFKGGSTGGRQAFVTAFRYPADWDHIIAGYPAINETGIGLLQWSHLGTVNTDRSTGCSYLQIPDFTTLNQAALYSCDKMDGLEDGVITYPDLCTIDWDIVRCNTSKSIFNSTTCLSEAKISAAKNIYSGPLDENGNPYIPPFLPGTELMWSGFVNTKGCYPNYYFNASIDFARHVAFEDDNEKPPTWTPWDIDYKADTKLATYMEGGVYSGQHADISAFKNNGGKLLFMQGLADYQVMAGWSIDHYDTTVRFFGQESTDDFFRLFVVPGQYHSWGTGPGASANMDLYSVLLKWVDEGIAPEMIHARHIEAGNYFERPVYRWPKMAEYNGGDPALASSFDPVERPAPWMSRSKDWLLPSA